VFAPPLEQFMDVADSRAVVALIGADVIENMAMMWWCGAAINSELEAAKAGLEAITELAFELATNNERLEKRVSKLEDAMAKLLPAAENEPLLAEGGVQLVGRWGAGRMTSAVLRANFASEGIEKAKRDEQRHRANAIFLLLRVRCSLWTLTESSVRAITERSHRSRLRSLQRRR
jgi:hypothetical protein